MTLTSDDIAVRARKGRGIDPWLSVVVARLIEQQGMKRVEVTGALGQSHEWLRQRLYGRVRWSVQDVVDVAEVLCIPAPRLLEMAESARGR